MSQVFSPIRLPEKKQGTVHFVDNRSRTVVQARLIRQIHQSSDPLKAVRQYMTTNGESEKATNSGGLLKALNSSSSSSSASEETTINLTYHHIIDKDSLMKYWNTLRKIRWGDRAIKEFKDTIHHLVERSRQHAATKASCQIDGEEAPSAKLEETALNSITCLGIVDKNLGEIIERMYQWMPGNIFCGPLPENRWHVGIGPGTNDQKDPNNGFETGARYIVPEQKYSRLSELNEEIGNTVDVVNKVESLNDLISSCKSGKKMTYTQELQSASSALKYVEDWVHLSFMRLWLIADQNEVFPYDKKNWIKVDEDGHTATDPQYKEENAKYLIVKR